MMQQPEADPLEATFRAAENAAAPSSQDSAKDGPGWFRGRGAQWPAERQLGFNRALMDLLQSLRESAAQQQAQIVVLQQQVAAALALGGRLEQLESTVGGADSATRKEVHDQIQQVASEMRETLQGVVRDEETRIQHLAQELRGSIAGVVADEEKRIQQLTTDVHGAIDRATGEQREAANRINAAIEQLRADQITAVEQLCTEQRERIQHVLDEQRVSMRQLALQTSEQAVLADRARRATELRLDELARELEQLRGATAR